MDNRTDEEIVWKDRSRIIFGLPWTFTRYSLTKEKLIVDTGFLNRKEEEIRLYRILDITLQRPFGQRLWGLGTVHLCTADKTTPEFEIKRIRNSKEFKNMLSDMVEQERNERRISGREYMGVSNADEDDDIDDSHIY